VSEKKFERGWEVLDKLFEGKEYLVRVGEPSTAVYLIALTVKWKAEMRSSPINWGKVMRLAKKMVRENRDKVCRREGNDPDLLIALSALS